MFSSVINGIKAIPTNTRKCLVWLSSEPHRRAAASVIAWLVVHYAGKDIDSGTVSDGLDLALGAILAAWSSHTPQVVEKSDGN